MNIFTTLINIDFLIVIMKDYVDKHLSGFSNKYDLTSDSVLPEDERKQYKKVFSDSFIRKYTFYCDFEQFIENSPVRDVRKFDEQINEQFIEEKTTFDSIEELRRQAAKRFVVNKFEERGIF